uniref:Uncharacterized protein TCIL3000_11_11060 n=1 Tax=Trypanosoma congolense (strain IL3000) TaxID=1068625 RepID=G0V1V0_TRYCI|nr:unnamed protein product [Trypanosoma congolense IL3000]
MTLCFTRIPPCLFLFFSSFFFSFLLFAILTGKHIYIYIYIYVISLLYFMSTLTAQPPLSFAIIFILFPWHLVCGSTVPLYLPLFLVPFAFELTLPIHFLFFSCTYSPIYLQIVLPPTPPLVICVLWCRKWHQSMTQGTFMHLVACVLSSSVEGEGIFILASFGPLQWIQ